MNVKFLHNVCRNRFQAFCTRKQCLTCCQSSIVGTHHPKRTCSALTSITSRPPSTTPTSINHKLRSIQLQLHGIQLAAFSGESCHSLVSYTLLYIRTKPAEKFFFQKKSRIPLQFKIKCVPLHSHFGNEVTNPTTRARKRP